MSECIFQVQPESQQLILLYFYTFDGKPLSNNGTNKKDRTAEKHEDFFRAALTGVQQNTQHKYLFTHSCHNNSDTSLLPLKRIHLA